MCVRTQCYGFAYFMYVLIVFLYCFLLKAQFFFDVLLWGRRIVVTLHSKKKAGVV